MHHACIQINIMKKLLAICFFGIISFNSFGQNIFHISGKLNNGTGNKLYLSEDVFIANSEKRIRDSTQIQNDGSFEFIGAYEYPGLYTLFINGRKDFLPVYIDSSKIFVEGDASKIYLSKITGSEEQNLQALYSNSVSPINNALESLMNKIMISSKNNDSVQSLSYGNQIDSLNRKKKDLINMFIEKYPFSYMTLELLSRLKSEEEMNITYEHARNLLPGLSNKFHSNPIYVDLVKFLNNLKKSDINSVFPNLSVRDTLNSNIDIKNIFHSSSFTIVDFWASWCLPCLKSNPILKSIQAEFEKYGVKIISISGDENESEWKNAIKVQKMNWVQCSDLKGTNSGAFESLAIAAYPTFILVDKNGVIVKRGIAEQALKEIHFFLKEKFH